MTDPAYLRLTWGPRPLHARFHRPDRPGPHPVLIQCHGFKGFMDWGFHPALADLLCERGVAVLRFSFSGCGVEPGGDRVTDFEAFRDNTLSRDVEDLQAVLEHVSELDPGRIDPHRVALFGHSRGGGMALLAASEAVGRERVRALVTWAAISTVDRISEEQKAQWRRDGVLAVPNLRTGQMLPMGLAMLEEGEENPARFDLLAAARRRTCPWLIVHGEEDETVPVAEGRALHTAGGPGCELVTLPGAGHTFGATHPFQGPTPQLIQALNATQAWLLPRLRATD